MVAMSYDKGVKVHKLQDSVWIGPLDGEDEDGFQDLSEAEEYLEKRNLDASGLREFIDGLGMGETGRYPTDLD
jgi:hypothetical protein